MERLSQGNGPTSNLRSYLFEMAYHAIVDEIRYSRRLAPIDVIGLSLSSGKSIDITVEEQTLMEVALRRAINDESIEYKFVRRKAFARQVL